MHRILLGLGALMLSLPAIAGPGTSVGLDANGIGSVFAGLDFTNGTSFQRLAFNAGFVPSFDWRADPLILQFHVIEFLGALSTEDVFIGANGYYDLPVSGPIGNGWSARVQPGVSLDLLADPFLLGLAAESRFGVETQSQFGFGVYVVPHVGFLAGDGDVVMLTGGALQFSWWVAQKGGGSSSRAPAPAPAPAPARAPDPAPAPQPTPE